MVDMTSTPLGAVVAGIDHTQNAARGLDWAAREAARRNAPLHILHAIRPPVTDIPPTPEEYRRIRADAERLVADAAERAMRYGAATVTSEVIDDSPGPALIAAGGHAGLLVVGARGHGPLSGLLLDSVSKHVSRHAHCPVVVVREQADPHASRIVVGIDQSHSDAAVEFAIGMCSRDSLPLVAIHSGPADPEQRVLNRVLAPWTAKYPDVDVTPVIDTGNPATALADASEHASMVVVGVRGHGGLYSLLPGSISQAVLHHAHCPVAVVG
jgi:nucleotide-binding universal stress UspA family protein